MARGSEEKEESLTAQFPTMDEERRERGGETLAVPVCFPILPSKIFSSALPFASSPTASFFMLSRSLSVTWKEAVIVGVFLSSPEANF